MKREEIKLRRVAIDTGRSFTMAACSPGIGKYSEINHTESIPSKIMPYQDLSFVRNYGIKKEENSFVTQGFIVGNENGSGQDNDQFFKSTLNDLLIKRCLFTLCENGDYVDLGLGITLDRLKETDDADYLRRKYEGKTLIIDNIATQESKTIYIKSLQIFVQGDSPFYVQDLMKKDNLQSLIVVDIGSYTSDILMYDKNANVERGWTLTKEGISIARNGLILALKSFHVDGLTDGQLDAIIQDPYNEIPKYTTEPLAINIIVDRIDSFVQNLAGKLNSLEAQKLVFVGGGTSILYRYLNKYFPEAEYYGCTGDINTIQQPQMSSNYNVMAYLSILNYIEEIKIQEKEMQEV